MENVTENALVLLVDDHRPGFWGMESPPAEGGLQFIGISKFSPGDNPLGSLKARWELSGVSPGTFRERFVITDGDLGDGLDGGAKFLQCLHNDADWRWTRAIIYSGEPWAAGLDSDLHKLVWALKRIDFNLDRPKIVRFLKTGQKQFVEPFIQLVGEVWEVSQIIITVRREPEAFTIDRLASCLSSWARSQPRRLWSLDTSADLGEALRGEFDKYLAGSAWRLLGAENQSDPAVDARKLHQRVLRLLDPFESLAVSEGDGSHSPIRRLWEWAASCDAEYFGAGRDALTDPRIGARGRCWVEERLKLLISNRDSRGLAPAIDDVLRASQHLLAIVQQLNQQVQDELDGV